MKILNASSYEVLTMNEKSTYCEYKKKDYIHCSRHNMN